MKDEKFVQIAWAPKYGVNRLGQVISLKTGKALKPLLDDKGYARVNLYGCTDGRNRATVNVASIVLKTFIGPRPVGLHAAHLNGKPSDNRLCNLKWCTPSENAMHKHQHGTFPVGQRHYKAKLTDAQAQAIKELYSKGKGATQLAYVFDVNRKTINQIVSGKIRKNVPALSLPAPAIVQATERLVEAAETVIIKWDGLGRYKDDDFGHVGAAMEVMCTALAEYRKARP